MDFYGILISISAIMIFVMIPSIVCGVAAGEKGRSIVGFFLLSFFFSPLIGFLAVIAFPPKERS